MKKDYTHIAIVLDRSGSMGSVKQDTIGGFNEFLKSQQEVKGEATLTLAQFDTMYELLQENANIQNVEPLTDVTYVPRGGTALLDAIGRTINSTGQFLQSLNPSQRPEKVVFVIITDGEENSSREFTLESVNEMITHQTEKYQWQFVFLGANQDAIQAGMSYGVSASNSMSFGHNTKGVSAMYSSVTSNLRNYREGGVADMSFSVDDREEQKKADAFPSTT